MKDVLGTIQELGRKEQIISELAFEAVCSDIFNTTKVEIDLLKAMEMHVQEAGQPDTYDELLLSIAGHFVKSCVGIAEYLAEDITDA